MVKQYIKKNHFYFLNKMFKAYSNLHGWEEFTCSCGSVVKYDNDNDNDDDDDDDNKNKKKLFWAQITPIPKHSSDYY